MPEWYFMVVVAVFGLIIGSFLNVVIYRFHTGRSLNDRSHCLSCGRKLEWYELFPVFSYLALQGRCRTCHSFIPYRYAVVEILTAALFLLAYLHANDLVSLILLCMFLSGLVVVAVYDLNHMIIPDELSVFLGVMAIASSGYQAYLAESLNDWPVAILSGVLAGMFFASLWWMSSGRWLGLGDAKLAVGLGIMVGLGSVFSLVVWSFWIGAVISVIWLTWQRIALHIPFLHYAKASVTMKTEIPFAPFLIASFFLAYFFDVPVLALIEHLYATF